MGFFDTIEIEDEAPVMIERVEDKYFEGIDFQGKKTKGWDVYNKEGYNYLTQQKLVEDLKYAKDLVDKGEMDDLDFNPEYIKKMKLPTQEELDALKEQFYPGWCISNDDDDIVLIFSHY